MKTLLIKEVRLLAPAWLVGIVVALSPSLIIPFSRTMGWNGGGGISIVSAVVALIGVVNLCISSMGRELDLGTFSQLLAQPTERIRIWRIKTRLLFAAIVTIVAAFWTMFPSFDRASDGEGFFPFICAFVAACFAGGLWLTLLLRHTVGAFWLTLVIPLAIVVSVGTLVGRESWTPDEETRVLRYDVFLLLAYATAGFMLARRSFLHAQDLQPYTQPVTITLPSSTISLPRLRHPRGVWGSLVRKELQLQQVNLLIAAVFSFICAIMMAWQYLFHETWESDRSFVKIGLWHLFSLVVWPVLPLIAGAAAVAEERKLGTLESQLCLPPGRRIQFIAKLAVVAGIGVGLGGALPWMLNQFAALFGVSSSTAIQGIPGLGMVCLTTTVIVIVAFFASTGSRSTLSAIGAGIALMVPIPGLIALAAAVAFIPEMRWWAGTRLWAGTLIFVIGVPVIFSVLLILGYRNFRRLQQGGVWLKDLGIICLALVLVGGVTSLIYHRVWEYAMTLEPTHGAPQFTRANPPKLGTFWAGARAFVLLPDGRIWASEEGSPEVHYDDSPVFGDASEVVTPPRITRGDFIGTGGWKQLAVTELEAAAIAGDGSLWTLATLRGHGVPFTPKPVQRGSASDWRHVSAGKEHFLALRGDGTLWGWGGSANGEVIDGVREYLREPVRIGNDSNWVGCVAGPLISMGMKSDGSTWCWGWTMKKGGLPVRLELPFDGQELVSLSGSNFEFHLKNGSVGRLNLVWPFRGKQSEYPPIQANAIYYPEFDTRKGATPTCVGSAGAYGQFVIKADGTLWSMGDPYSDSECHEKWSMCSDWITITGTDNATALSADGTLCLWESHWNSKFVAPNVLCLAPTRRPAYSLNIFAKSPQ